MSRYFLAPRSGEKSHKNFLSTLKHGVPYARIEPYLDERGKEILSKQEVIYAWANREGKKESWERMEEGDTVIFYAKGAFVMVGDVIYKQHSNELALAMWPADDNGQPWSYTYYLNNIRYIKIPLPVFNALSGYKFVALMGFQEIGEPYKQQILTRYKNFDELFADFADESSVEMPDREERVYINIPKSVTPEISNRTIVAYQESASPGTGKKRSGYVDFDEVNKRHAKVGSLGEEIVLRHEKQHLASIGRGDLAEKVQQLSLEDTYAGYDILSFDEHGAEKKIEVKATVAKQGSNFRFHISRNEIRVAKSSDNYSIYLVYGVDTDRPTIHIVPNPFKEANPLTVEPVAYIVKGKFS